MKLLTFFILFISFKVSKSGDGALKNADSTIIRQIANFETFTFGRPKRGFLGIIENTFSDVFRSKSDKKEIESKWYTQTLDHFYHLDRKTWKQRYWVNSQHYKPGGPLLLFLGGEAELSPFWAEHGNCADIAAQQGARLFLLEHRYYGKSRPVRNSTTENLKWLTSEQALADSATFVQHMKKEYGMAGAKVIAFGGSYSGNLAIWLRQKYSSIVDGAVGSSAPVLAKVNFYEYNELVSKTLDVISPGCSASLTKAFDGVDISIQKNEMDRIRKAFNTCEPINGTDQNTVSALFMQLSDDWKGLVQSAYGATGMVKYFCGLLRKPSKPVVERLGSIYRTLHQTCMETDYRNMVNRLRKTNWDTGGMRLWFYQTCNEFGYYQTTDGASQPFGKHLSLEFLQDLACRQIFGLAPRNTARNIAETNRDYGAKSLETSNIVLPNGLLDPWHSLGIVKNINPTAVSVLIPDCGGRERLSLTAEMAGELVIERGKPNSSHGIHSNRRRHSFS